MTIYYQDELVTLHHGDCLDVLSELTGESVHAIVTDPPYGLANTTPEQVADTLVRWVNGDRDYLPGGKGFMGKEWDAFVPPVAVWDECLRVLKPGGHVLAFAGSRTHDLMTLGLRLAGFDIRDSVAWLYGSGFPKSLDVSKAIANGLNKAPKPDPITEWRFTEWMRSTGITARQINEVTGTNMGGHYLTASSQPAIPTAALMDILRPLLPEVPQWIEDEILSREQAKAEAAERSASALFLDTLATGDRITSTTPATPEAEQWQGWGTALKPAFEPVVVARKPIRGTVAANVLEHGTGALNIDACRIGTDDTLVRPSIMHDDNTVLGRGLGAGTQDEPQGRWPANVVLDESQAAELDQQSGYQRDGVAVNRNRKPDERASWSGTRKSAQAGDDFGYGSGGGASRFFYVAKASKAERPIVDGIAHPTVKPVALMGWLVRLVTPPGGTVLDPFAGSGTTLEAAGLEGFSCIGIEREADYLPLIRHRIDRNAAARATEAALRQAQLDLFGDAS